MVTCSRARKQGGQRKGGNKRAQKESYSSLPEMLSCILDSKCKYQQELGIKTPDSAASTLTPFCCTKRTIPSCWNTEPTHTHSSQLPGRAHTAQSNQSLLIHLTPPFIPYNGSENVLLLQAWLRGQKNPKQTTNHLMHLKKNSVWL